MSEADTIVQVEQKTGHALVIDSAPPVCFILGNKLHTHTHCINQITKNATFRKITTVSGVGVISTHLSTVLRDELVLLDWLFDKRTPPRNIRGGQEQVLANRLNNIYITKASSVSTISLWNNSMLASG